MTQAQLDAFRAQVNASAANGFRVFEPVLNQWAPAPTTKDGVSDETKTLLDAIVELQPAAVFVLWVRISPRVADMFAGCNKGGATQDAGWNMPTPADPDWLPQATAELVTLLRTIDALYPGRVAGVHLTALQGGE